MKTAIIIPARMASQRFPNKPMAKINGIPMIERVWRQGINSKAGDVYVACSEDEVFNLIVSNGGKAIMTDPNLPSGTDRVFAAFNLLDNKHDYESIINLQGDMPLIDYKNIQSANIPLQNGYEIGTIATGISSNEIDRKLEQLRALDAGIKIGITYVENVPISVDTVEDLMLIENILNSTDENK